MIITFCGHSDFCATEAFEKKLLSFLAWRVGDRPAALYLGEYGAFDSFAYQCCKKYQRSHANVSLVFVTPYLNDAHLDFQKTRFDTILYPGIENRPPRVAILYRNQYMVEKADCVVAYIKRAWGGAYTTYKYAQRKSKELFNLAEETIETAPSVPSGRE